jgi:hypothetical protein
MNSIKYACSLNNQGVDFLISGESSQAREFFQCALSLLNQAQLKAETTSCTEMNISCDDASLPFSESTLKVPGLQGLNCFVYDHGIMIFDNVNGYADEKPSLYIAIVLFNSALTSHSEGMALGRAKSLMKASALYSLLVQLLTRCRMPEDTLTSILMMLAWNNKAQIHYDQCEYVQSVDCMKNISMIMGSSVRGLHSSLNYEDLEGILLNVMLLSTPSAAQAA